MRGTQHGSPLNLMVSPTVLVVVQYALAAMALACLVASEVASWGLSSALIALLGGVVGLAFKRPSDMLAPKE